MTCYALELVNLKNEKPEVMEALMKGAFSINRSGNAFAGVAVGVAGVADMASEQSINAHAKNCLKGIMTYADIDSAVNRWHVTSPMRSEISNALLKYADMKSNEGGNKEVKEQRDKEDLEKLKKLVTSTINPFQQRRPKDYLFNLKIGKQVTKVAETYLLNVMKERKRFGWLLFYHSNKKEMFTQCFNTQLCQNHLPSRIQMALCEIIQSLMFTKY